MSRSARWAGDGTLTCWSAGCRRCVGAFPTGVPTTSAARIAFGANLTEVGVFSITARKVFINDVHDGHNMLTLAEIELRGQQCG